MSDHGRPAPGRQRGRRHPARIALSWSIFAVVMFGVWSYLGPTQLGGPVAYVMVDGRSMEPTYRDGDLIVARSSDRYEVGDVITYVADIGGTGFPVIHRIIEVTPEGGYVTQGDNRDEPDAFHITPDNIIGASWLRVPRAGVAVTILRQPITIALAAGLIVFRVLARRERAGDEQPAPDAQSQPEPAGAGLPLGPTPEPGAAGGRGPVDPVKALLGLALAVLAVSVVALGASASILHVDAGVLQEFLRSPSPEEICGMSCLP